jgi:Stress responsive A/B Barrel Domain
MINEKNGFIHHVFFWLHEPANNDALTRLIEGLKKLSAAKTIQTWHIGKPASTRREVIDSTYSVSWLLTFKNKADQDDYQTDPIHLKFIEECSTLWSKVAVYDTVNIDEE